MRAHERVDQRATGQSECLFTGCHRASPRPSVRPRNIHIPGQEVPRHWERRCPGSAASGGQRQFGGLGQTL